jgi:hypothetical protein
MLEGKLVELFQEVRPAEALRGERSVLACALV